MRAFLLVLVGCGTTPPAPDASTTADATIEAEASAPLPDCTLDGGTLSDWDGWHRSRAFNGCCMTDVPDDVDASIPPLNWVPCDGGNCTSLDMTWDAGDRTPSFNFPTVSRGANGDAHYMRLTRSLEEQLGDATIEWDVYDLAKMTAVGAWRSRGTSVQLAGECYVAPIPTPTGVGLLAEDYRANEPVSFWLGWGDVETAMHAPMLNRFGGKELVGFQDMGVSDTTLAFDVAGVNAYRLPFGATSYAHAVKVPPLLFSVIEGDNAFFESEYGNAGWGQIWRLDADASTTLVREQPSRHVFSPATDGQTLFWIEAYGPNSDLAQPMDAVEVWASPYSADPSVINTNAHKLASFANARVPAFPIAFHGTYVLNTLVTTPAWHAVRSDGTVADIAPPLPNTYIHYSFYVDQTELWSTLSGVNGPPDFALVRIPLPAFKTQ